MTDTIGAPTPTPADSDTLAVAQTYCDLLAQADLNFEVNPEAVVVRNDAGDTICLTRASGFGLPDSTERVVATLWREVTRLVDYRLSNLDTLLEHIGELESTPEHTPAIHDLPTFTEADWTYARRGGEGATAEDVLRALTDALELAEVWLVDGGDGTVEDRLRMFAVLRDWQKRGGRLATVVDDVKRGLVNDMDGPECVDGQWYRAHRKAQRKGFDKDGLRAAVNREAFEERTSFDPINGEVLGKRTPTTQEVAETIWKATDIATGRTKVLREEFGIDLDEYAQTEWKTELEACDFADLKPEERGETPEEAQQ